MLKEWIRIQNIFFVFLIKKFLNFRIDINKKIKQIRNFVWNIKYCKSLIKRIKQIF